MGDEFACFSLIQKESFSQEFTEQLSGDTHLFSWCVHVSMGKMAASTHTGLSRRGSSPDVQARVKTRIKPPVVMLNDPVC